jgi:hypothetical protein
MPRPRSDAADSRKALLIRAGSVPATFYEIVSRRRTIIVLAQAIDEHVHAEEEIMSDWRWDSWILQYFAVVLVGAGVIVAALFALQRGGRRRRADDVGVPGNLPAFPGINISRVVIGGDVAGLVLVVWVLAVLLFSAWGWFLAVTVGAALVAVALFLWHRFHPR